MAALLGSAPALAGAGASGWSVVPSPNPQGAKVSGLNAVSCTSASVCTAVGASGRGPLAERWDGTRWRIQPTPELSDRDALYDVACPSASDCVAVGVTLSQGGGVALIERWNGRKWSIQPTPGTETAALAAVSCSSPQSCVAVGYDYPRHTRRQLVQRWNGGKWSTQPTPDLRFSSLSGVSCTSARACTAGGTYLKSHARSLGALAERWNGRDWSIQQAPSKKNHTVGLASVSCTSAGLCTAVGQDELPPPCESTGCGEYIQSKTLVERRSGGSWSLQPSPNPKGYPALTGVSCVSATACTAVGGTPGPLAERWNGGRWQVQGMQIVQFRPVRLAGVSCVSRSLCFAVGRSTGYGPDSNGTKTLVERWQH